MNGDCAERTAKLEERVLELEYRVSKIDASLEKAGEALGSYSWAECQLEHEVDEEAFSEACETVGEEILAAGGDECPPAMVGEIGEEPLQLEAYEGFPLLAPEAECDDDD